MELPRRFENKDIKSVYSWMSLRSLPLPPVWSLSNIGMIIDDLAAGFLYTTNSGIAYLDSFVTNPESNKVNRHIALEAVANSLIDYAKTSRIDLVMCSSKFDSITQIARGLGFQDNGSHLAMGRRL